MAEERPKRLAVLIDADNASAKIVDGLFEEIAALGEASVRRIYGDFSSPRSKGWAEVLNKFAILPQQQFANTVGKNASDIALVIDAMDLLHSGRFDGFCLVSSDSDFTRLASRIREEGADVFGFGEQKTPESFRQACRRFIYTENLLPADPVSAEAPVRKFESMGKAKKMLERVIAEMGGEGEWHALGGVGSQLLNLAPDFDSRNYGFPRLSELVAKIDSLEVTGDAGHRRVRRKPSAAKPAPKS
ncbi:MAG: NYN domain-containing protein [Hyphomicrobiales bacterium]|nr:MAG: NYN domain-containing protein [Hyphomicrobiales bacterium]